MAINGNFFVGAANNGCIKTWDVSHREARAVGVFTFSVCLGPNSLSRTINPFLS